jgi:hypothetical protein
MSITVLTDYIFIAPVFDHKYFKRIGKTHPPIVIMLLL